MGPTWKETSAVAGLLVRRDAFCRPSEKILVAYFFYTALLATVRALPAALQVFAWTVPTLLLASALVETRYSSRWSGIARDWVVLAFVLIGYWQIQLFAAPPLNHLHRIWIQPDRFLLDTLSLRAAIESAGWLFPSVLEFFYLSLYAIPPLCVAALFVYRRRHRIDRFLLTFFLGTFCAYALLPHFPSLSPRVAFPGRDLPHYFGFWSAINLWLQAHWDISTSVFPSGHVAAAFSASFGLLRALPDKKRLCTGVFIAATLVFVATIYCRYHWAADGLTSICIAVLAWRLTAFYDPND